MLILIIPALLYIPAVQDFARGIALSEVKKSTGMDINVDYLRLRFPLKVELRGVSVVEASGDTMVTASAARLNVKPLPLLQLRLDVNGVELDNATYRLGTPDSALYLTAAVKQFTLDNTDLGLKSGTIDIGDARLAGGHVWLAMRPDTTTTPTDTTAGTKWVIRANSLELDSVRFGMTMLPTIDSLGVDINRATLMDATVDMQQQLINADTLGVTLANARYLLPTKEYLAQNSAPAANPDTTASDVSAMWRIMASHVGLRADTATYAVRNARPLPGLDMNYLQVSGVEIAVDSFYNCGTAITVPLRTLRATERCGVSLLAKGLFAMDSTAMHASDFIISTGYSRLTLDAMMGMGDLTGPAELPLKLVAEGALAPEDITMALPTVAPMLRCTPRSPVHLTLNVDGSNQQLRVNDLAANWARFITFSAGGVVNNPFDFNHMKGRVNFTADAIDLNSAKGALLDPQLAHTLNIPRTRLTGKVDYNPGLINGALTAVTSGGRLALDGKWNQRAEGYDAALHATDFPVDAFMPSLGVGPLTATVKLNGRGYNPMSPATTMNVDVDVIKAEYLKQPYSDIMLQANLHNGQAKGSLRSANPDAFADLNFDATISADSGYIWRADGNIANIDLMAMKLSPTPSAGSLTINTSGRYNPRLAAIDANVDVRDLKWHLGDMIVATPSITANLLTSDTTVNLQLENGDLKALMAATCGLDTLLAHITATTARIDSVMARHAVDVRALQRALPPLRAIITAGRNNVARSFLEASNMDFRNLTLSFNNDSLMNLDVNAIGFQTGDTRLDTLSFGMVQHGRFLAYKGGMHNRPGNMDNFSKVTLTGFVADDKMSALLHQENLAGETGFQLGLGAGISDSIVNVKFAPYTPTIGYRKWKINRDNFVKYNFVTRHIDANLAVSADSSYIRLYTEHSDSLAADHSEDVVLQMANINLKDWLSVSPFAPPINGELGADMRFRWDARELTGRGKLDLDELYYGRDRVGSFTVGLDVVNGANGLHADASLLVDSVEVITARGALNDSTARNPFLLDFSMIRFPLRVVNPFLPKEYAQLSGVLNGRMDITGDMAHPVFNGTISFDSTAVKVGMLGTSFTFDDRPIPVDSNIVNFDNFAIKGCNDNPLTVSGTVDARQLSDIKLDLGMRARNMQVVNSSRPRGAQLYGKGFLNVDADVKGNMALLNVDAKVNVLAGTNVTYIVESSENALMSQANGEMVKFVQFNDTTQVLKADSIAGSAMSMNLDANLVISQGSIINVDLPGGGQNKASIQGEGDLTFTMTPFNDGRLTGRFTINSGYARYAPPVISLLDFTFVEGSYIAFTGDMLNPSLNISATDKIKANVTQSGQNSRLVDFIVTLTASNTLQNLDVKFDLATDNDLTISNELSSMSPQQRANQAMNLLLYNTYTGPDTKASSNLSGNPLFSFLTSQLNSWAANNIKGVDISFGVDQYDKTNDGSKSTTTSYSYRVSKSLFNDRFKIIVGGNYSTDANADENFSQNLINDISFEYMLNRSGSMYVRLFRHTGYESILEGEVTQTGVGFVYKRKVRSLRDVFKFLLPRRRKTDNANPEVK